MRRRRFRSPPPPPSGFYLEYLNKLIANATPQESRRQILIAKNIGATAKSGMPKTTKALPRKAA